MATTAQLRKAQRSDAGSLMIDLEKASAADRPDYKSTLWHDQQDDVVLVRDVLAGTGHMRDKGETYLPRHKAEESSAYERRKKAAVLFNATRRTRDGLTGMIFRRDPIPSSDMPEEIAADLENIDLRGRSLPVFAQELAKNAIADGHALIHVDFPKTPDGGFRSRGEERASVRPYWRALQKQDLINVRWEIQAGRPTFTLAVLQEESREAQGRFGEVTRTRYRVLRPGSFEVWEHQERGDGSGVFMMVDEGDVSLDYIPLFAVYANRTGFLDSTPPLLDLAYENIGHYQVRSDHRYALSFAAVSVPFLAGVDPESIQWGPDRYVATENGDAKGSMLESSGAGLEQSREELRDIEGRMAFLGLQMLAERGVPQGRTATAKLLDKAESDSALAATARSLEDGINEALQAHADFRGTSDVGSVQVNTDFQAMTMDAQSIAALSTMVEKGQLPLEDLWTILQEGEILPADFDPELARERIQTTGPMTDLLALTQAGTRSAAQEPPLP